MTHSSRDNKPVAVEQIEADQRAEYWRARIAENDKLAYMAWLLLTTYRNKTAGLYDPERLATTHEGQVALRTTLSAFEQGAENSRLRLAGQDRGEGYREALNRIANLGCCGGHGKFEAALDIAVSALTSAPVSTQPPPVSDVRPIPMLLWCPQCHTQHIDEPDERALDWSNPPHRSHLCHACGCIWRPADVPTEGVAAIETKGKADTFDARQALAHAAVGEGYAVGTKLIHGPSGARVTVTGRVEGWYDVICSDGSHVVCRPSNLSAAPRPIQAGEGK